MPSAVFQPPSCTYSQSQMTDGASNISSDSDSMLNKRQPIESCHVRDDSSVKLMAASQACTEVDDKDKCSFPRLKRQRSDSCVESRYDSLNAHDGRRSTSKSELQRFDLVLQDKKSCYKILLKHFLLESLVNEKFNLKRFKILPGVCKTLSLSFLERHFGFELNQELNKGSVRKHLYELKGRKYQTTNYSTVALPFLADCYLHGLTLQLKNQDEIICRDQAIEVLHRTLLKHGVKIKKEEFRSTLVDLLTYRNEHICNPDQQLSGLLLSKMSQIKNSTLAKFYLLRLKTSLSDLIDKCESMDDLQSSISKSAQVFDVLSSYQGHQAISSICYYRFCSFDMP